MPRFFNTAGPNDPAKHYTLPALARLPDVRTLIEQELYFVVHAPRQVGKTTALLTLARELTAEGRYIAVALSMERGAPLSHDIGAAELTVLQSWRDDAHARLPANLQPPPWPAAPPGNRIAAALRAWAEAAPRPLVVFLDAIDSLQDETLISILRQIRSSYSNRPAHFPQSLALVGLRALRDQKVSSGRRDGLSAVSHFNIAAESLVLRNFTRDEIADLYDQHTVETGLAFRPEAVDRVFELTQGQP